MVGARVGSKAWEAAAAKEGGTKLRNLQLSKGGIDQGSKVSRGRKD